MDSHLRGNDNLQRRHNSIVENCVFCYTLNGLKIRLLARGFSQ